MLWVDPYGLSQYPGVGFSGTGALYPDGVNTIKIQLTGGRRGDFKNAIEAAGYNGVSGWPTGNAHPNGYTWHHVNDYDHKSNTSTMQLVSTEAHMESLPHSGSVSQFEKANGVKYETPAAKQKAHKLNSVESCS